jgi:hypothetical protein
MAQLGFVVNSENCEYSGVISKLPIGRHIVVATSSEIKGAKPKEGEQQSQNGMVEYTIEIIQGPHKGTIGADRFNIFHTNEMTANIARRQLNDMAWCVNAYNTSDSDNLLNVPYMIEVGYQKGQEDKEESQRYTEIKKRMDCTGASPRKGVPACTVPPSETVAPYGGAPEAQVQPPAQTVSPHTQAWQNQTAGGAPAQVVPPQTTAAPAWANNNANAPAAKPAWAK